MANKEKNLKPTKAVDNKSYRRRVGKAPKKPVISLSSIVDKKVEQDPNWLDQFLPKGRKMRHVRANVARALPFVEHSMPHRAPAIAAPCGRSAGMLIVLGRDLYPPTVKPRSKRGWPNGGKALRKVEAAKAEAARKVAQEERRKVNVAKHVQWAEDRAAKLPAEQRLDFLSGAGLSPSMVTNILDGLAAYEVAPAEA